MRRLLASALFYYGAVAVLVVGVVGLLCPLTSATDLALFDWALRHRVPPRPGPVVLVRVSSEAPRGEAPRSRFLPRPANCRCTEGAPWRSVYGACCGNSAGGRCPLWCWM